MKAWLALAAVAVMLLAVLARYEVIAIPAGGNEGQAVLLDRWTGQTRPVWTSPTISYEVGKGWITWPNVLPPGVELNPTNHNPYDLFGDQTNANPDTREREQQPSKMGLHGFEEQPPQ